MPRNYSQEFLLEVNRQDPDMLGTQLALSCVEANLPAVYVAEALGVSRMTIHSWFRGKPLRYNNAKRVGQFVIRLKQDLDNGTLPAATIASAKTYLKNLGSVNQTGS